MTDNTTNKHTTADDLVRAHAALHRNWDDAGVTMVYLPRAIAEKVLTDHGWRRDRWRGGPGPWLSPSGERIWDTDEAVALTIAAETLTETQVKEQPTEDRRLRALVTAVLQRDPPQGEADEVVIERIVAAEPGPVIVAALDHRLVIASLAGAPNQLWHQLAARVISAIDATSSNATNNSKHPDGR